MFSKGPYQKGFRDIIWVLIIVVALAGAIGYFTLIPATQTQSKAIEKIDFKKFLILKYESTAVQPKGGDLCEPGSTELKNVSYGDLTGDGAEDAVINYRTCWNGTGGDNSEVYTFDDKKNLVDITPDSTKLSASDSKKFFDGFAGHGYFGIDKTKLIFFFPVYKDGDPNCCPTGGKTTITFKWSGSKFIYDKVTTDPSAN